MKKALLTILFCGVMVLVLTGCKSTDKVQGNNIEENYQKYSKIINNIKIELEIPNEWKYKEISKSEADDFYKYALKLYKSTEEEYAMLYFYDSSFAVCGTGRTTENIILNNGKEATIGYYHWEKKNWNDISFYSMNKNVALINYNLTGNEASEIIEFIKSIEIIENESAKNISMSIKENSLTDSGITLIMKNNSEQKYYYGPEYYIEKYENETFKTYEPKEILSWNSVLYNIEVNEEKEIVIDWSYGYGKLDIGKYRLFKYFTKDGNMLSSSNVPEKIYVEFEIK